MTDIWQPISIGTMHLSNRFAMAPMTRSRAKPDGTPGDLAAQYYEQRASVGLIISEGTQPSEDGQGYLASPGIYTDAHVAGWHAVSTAVHGAGGRLFIQLMHVGRISHPDNTLHHRQAVAPSAIAPGVQMFTAKGMQDIPTPRELSLDEIQSTIADFRHAAQRAVEAGADGVEIHGANGYLLQQFLAANANARTDGYGGSIENRARLTIEVAAAVAEAIGKDRTAIRLSPGSRLNGIDEGSETSALYLHLIKELDRLGLGYLHILHGGNDSLLAEIRCIWQGALIVNRPGRPLSEVGSDVQAGTADMESYGQLILANPDFLARLKSGSAMNPPDHATFYGGGAKGYVDYPALGEAH